MHTLAGTDVSVNLHSKQFLKVTEVSKLVGVPVSTVYELARQKRIGGMIRFGRHIRFDRDALKRWLEAGGEGSSI